VPAFPIFPWDKHGVPDAAQGRHERDTPNLWPTPSKGQRHFPSVAPPALVILNFNNRVRAFFDVAPAQPFLAVLA
jgi:hypothetical protein